MKKLWEMIYLSDAFDPIFRLWCWLTDWSSVERFFYWGWKLRRSYDFEAHFVYQMLYLKYSRILKLLQENNRHTSTAAHCKRLAVVVELSRRVWENNYLANALAPHERKWGELQWSACDTELWGSYFPKATTPADKAAATREWKFAAKHAQEQEKLEKQQLFALLAKYNDYFWD